VSCPPGDPQLVDNVASGDRAAEVPDRSKLRGELARLGHPVAEAHLLDEFDAEEVRR